MQRINTGDELFQGGDPATNTKGTVVTPEWLNSFQEELAGVVEGLGGALDPADNAQLFDWLIASFANINGSAAQQFFSSTPTQFDNGPKVATTTFVKNASGSASAHTLIGGNVTLAAINAGNICYFSAAAVATLPLANTVPAGTVINFVSMTSGATSVARQGADIIEASSTSNALTSMALLDGETLALESNGVDRWIAVGGSVQLKYGGGFGASLLPSGYQKLPSGLIVQWSAAVVTGANTLNTFVYPIAFPNSALMIAGTSGSVGAYAGAVFLSNSQFNLFSSNAGGSVSWIAVGY